MKTIYDDADRYLKQLKDDVRRTFNSMSVKNFDELQYPQIREVVKAVYEHLLNSALKMYLKAARSAVKIAKEKCPHGADWMPDEEWVKKSLKRYNPITKYLWFAEADRKRLRETEALVTMVAFQDHEGLRQSIRSGANAWWKQAGQGMIDVVDDAVVTEYKKSGIKEVVWVSEHDERVCEECEGMDGTIYPIDAIPEKPHYNCRCTVEPVTD